VKKPPYWRRGARLISFMPMLPTADLLVAYGVIEIWQRFRMG